MKEKEDKLKLMKQILVNNNDVDIKGKIESKETISVTNDTEIPTFSKTATIASETVSCMPTTPKTTVGASTVKFDDNSNLQLSRKVNIPYPLPYCILIIKHYNYNKLFCL